MIDQTRKRALIDYIKRCEAMHGQEVLITPDRYFDGYDHHHCTVCANVGPFSTVDFAAKLQAIRNRADVAAAFIRFYEYADALEFEDSWIGSDSVYVVTSASADVVRNWFADLHPSDAWEEGDLTRFPDIKSMPQGHRLIAVWWD